MCKCNALPEVAQSEPQLVLTADEAAAIRQRSYRLLTLMGVIAHLYDEEVNAGRSLGAVSLEDVVDVATGMADSLYQAIRRPIFEQHVEGGSHGAH